MPTLTVIPILAGRMQVDIPESGVLSKCTSIQDAIVAYAQLLSASLSPDVDSQCYRIASDRVSLPPTIVDIHVTRCGKDLCTNGNVDFMLEDSDVVRLCLKIC